MRSIIALVCGALLGFAASALAVVAAVLLLAGVGGGILARQRPVAARLLNYDPSSTILLSVAVGVAALALGALFIVIDARLRRASRRPS